MPKIVYRPKFCSFEPKIGLLDRIMEEKKFWKNVLFFNITFVFSVTTLEVRRLCLSSVLCFWFLLNPFSLFGLSLSVCHLVLDKATKPFFTKHPFPQDLNASNYAFYRRVSLHTTLSFIFQ